jgi:glutaconate CoA-transferase, subunit A
MPSIDDSAMIDKTAKIDKTTTIAAVVDSLSDGMTIGVGGWASRRKPMALVEAICASDLQGLTIVSYGGPDVGMLCAAGKVKKLIFGFVSLDTIALEPNFRRARQTGQIDVLELDEGLLWLGLQAAAWRVPFLPCRAGLGSGVMTYAPHLKTVRSPYDDGEELLAMPALPLDVALCHANEADRLGNVAIHGPDPFFDDLYCMAAAKAYVSVERVVDRVSPVQTTLSRLMVSGVVAAPRGAGFTSCPPDYERDEAAQKAYAMGGA